MKRTVLFASLLLGNAASATPLQSGRIAVPDSYLIAASGTRAQTRTVYLNKSGITVSPGSNDSRANKSSLVTKPSTIAPWNTTPQVWSQTVTCLKGIFAPFDIAITETDPGTVPHIEAVFGGTAANLGLQPGMAGVSPFSTSCSIIEHSIVFAFTSSLPQQPQIICEVMAQEIAHSYGLDHEMLASDPMTYLSYSGKRTFQNTMASCGETSARPCGIGGSVCRAQQNSYALLMERIGAAGTGDIDAPSVKIVSPRDGAIVTPSFVLSTYATDDVSVSSMHVTIDGVAIQPDMTPPAPGADAPTGLPPAMTFTAPADLAPGEHVVEVIASDGKNETATSITVTVSDGYGDASDDAAGGCSSGGGTGWLFGLFLVGLVAIQRRAQR
jgi:MYXO-CTERM domain-containing protein